MSAQPTPGASAPDANVCWRALHAEAALPYRRAGGFAWRFARGKLGFDPVFRALVERGLLGRGALRVVDIGCGQGLLASLIDAMHRHHTLGLWPSQWPAAPRTACYVGVELMPRDVARGEQAIDTLDPKPELICGDMRSTPLPACDVVVILDVLHYVDIPEQDAVLARVRDALRAGVDARDGAGRLLLRVGDSAERRAFAISQWVDHAVTRVRGHRAPPTWGRPLADWTAALKALGFAVQSMPMSQGTPFANVLLVCDLKADGAA